MYFSCDSTSLAIKPDRESSSVLIRSPALVIKTSRLVDKSMPIFIYCVPIISHINLFMALTYIWKEYATSITSESSQPEFYRSTILLSNFALTFSSLYFSTSSVNLYPINSIRFFLSSIPFFDLAISSVF